MKIEIKVPALGESIVEATVGTLLKEDGAQVKENEEICELETEKVNQVLYAPGKGKISWKVKTGDLVKIDSVIGTIDTEGAVEEKVSEKPSPPKEIPKEKPQEKKEPSPEPPPERVQIAGEVRKPLSTLRKSLSKKLVETLRQTAMLTTFNEVDMTAVQDIRSQFKDAFQEKYKIKLGLTSFFVKAVSSALHAFPEINAYIDEDALVYRESQNIGIAVGGAKGGLVVPIIKQADKLRFHEIEEKINQLAARAREGKLSIPDLEGGTFTITNGGVYGSLLSTPLLSPKQSGILGLHKIEKRVRVIEDKMVIRPMMYIALSYDHRIVDGKEAIGFLIHIKDILEEPSRLIVMED